ncbi:MAG: poly-gamma-glutamate biosynthesis protein PgsC [bacterium]|nr:poly-gamma-glutamate biosynthesis protein PgsC [bacterium]
MGYEASFIALVLSLVFTSLTGFYPGGIIVPSFIVLFADQPERIIGTLAAAVLTVFCYKLMSRHLILFGRRRFVMIILTGALWTLVWLKVFPYLAPATMEFRMIGWVIPGLIANNFEKQGVTVTTAGLITVTAASYFAGELLKWIL